MYQVEVVFAWEVHEDDDLVSLEEHQVVFLLCHAIMHSGPFANASLCGETGPSPEFMCVHLELEHA